MNQDELKKNVDTIFVLIMENRSFDNVLGYLRHPDEGRRVDVAGIEDLKNDNYINKNSSGLGVRPFWMDDRPLSSDLPHDSSAVATALQYSPLTRKSLMTGFVRAYEDEFHSQVDDPPVMGLLRAKDLPTTSVLAEQYTVCDNWFACIPTSTAPNRLMSMGGMTNLSETKILVPDQLTVYDWLLNHGIRWRVYAAGLPFFALLPRLGPLLLTSHFRGLDELEHDIHTEASDDWPQVVFIEPDYYDCPVHFGPPCDNHAPLAMGPGEAFLARVYGLVSSNQDRWNRSVFIVTYDEHGGFFDHVSPLPITYSNTAASVGFSTTGPRTPTIIAGPYAPARGVSKIQLDNTAVLQLIADRFGSTGEAYSSEVLGRQHQGIGSISSVLQARAANIALCKFGTPAAIAAQQPTTVINSDLRQAFDQSIKGLANRHQTEVLAKYPALRQYLAGS